MIRSISEFISKSNNIVSSIGCCPHLYFFFIKLGEEIRTTPFHDLNKKKVISRILFLIYFNCCLIEVACRIFTNFSIRFR